MNRHRIQTDNLKSQLTSTQSAASIGAAKKFPGAHINIGRSGKTIIGDSA